MSKYKYILSGFVILLILFLVITSASYASPGYEQDWIPTYTEEPCIGWPCFFYWTPVPPSIEIPSLDTYPYPLPLISISESIWEPIPYP